MLKSNLDRFLFFFIMINIYYFLILYIIKFFIKVEINIQFKLNKK